MKAFLLSFGLLVFGAGALHAATVPPPSTPVLTDFSDTLSDGRQFVLVYFLQDTKVTWDEAQSYMRSVYGETGNLARLDNAQEQNIAENLLFRTDQQTWIGLRRFDSSFEWVDGGASNAEAILDWIPGQPVFTPDRRCGALEQTDAPAGSNFLTTQNCDEELRQFIGQFEPAALLPPPPAAVVPLPAGFPLLSAGLIAFGLVARLQRRRHSG